MEKINEIIINGIKYVHTADLKHGRKMYATWKQRGKISEDSFILVSGGLYLREDVALGITRYGLPSKNKARTFEGKLKFILNNTKSKRSLEEDLADFVKEEAKKLIKEVKHG